MKDYERGERLPRKSEELLIQLVKIIKNLRDVEDSSSHTKLIISDEQVQGPSIIIKDLEEELEKLNKLLSDKDEEIKKINEKNDEKELNFENIYNITETNNFKIFLKKKKLRIFIFKNFFENKCNFTISSLLNKYSGEQNIWDTHDFIILIKINSLKYLMCL